MEKIIQALAETNIPTIITVSGIALLFLALAGRFGTYIEIKKERQNAAAVVGGLLLLIGVTIYAYPLVMDENGAGSGSQSAGGSTGTTATPLPPRPSSQARWIIAGSFSSKPAADQRLAALANAQIDALTVTSDLYDFLCPGYFTVMVLAPDREAMLAMLEKVRTVEPSAFPRNPTTFDRGVC